MRTRGITVLLPFALIVSLGAQLAFARDPLGEVARYKLDKSRGRTSSLIKNATLIATAQTYIPAADGHPDAFTTSFEYMLDIMLTEKRTGTESMNLQGDLFRREFIEKLRIDKDAQMDAFKLKHVGMADAVTRDGQTYPQCDKILAYDFDLTKKTHFVDLIKEVLRSTGHPALDGAELDVKNLNITLSISNGLPVLGAAQVDIKGLFNGFFIKIGLDYTESLVKD